ncbi:hypothetical protein G4B88_017927 [Cannabis sativa]|uniref:Radical S-adenosyl methionine domain-containing protein 1, mitochondrial n=1 Tax=Cannabis sativa TaxID=3483 RepID=A0A7J6HIG7_CANSA|nr:hypothetical protein G4B88_017927 [Cannabis sativa]
MLTYGCTRLEIGVQSTYEDVARDTNRGHTVAAVADCFCLAKDAGFKMLKVYRNYPPEQLVDIVARILALVPPWTRVYRVQRDIPMPLVTSGVEKGNLRELALARMEDLGLKCRDVRTREAGIQDIHHKIKPEQVELVRRDYAANEGWETFLSYEDIRQDILVGLLRLRKCGRNTTCPELMGKCSIVRELHVYGTAVPVHGRDADKLQHQPFQLILTSFSQTPSTVRQNAPTADPILLQHQLSPASAYIHLPFCRKRCHYCDFPIVALGSGSTQTEDEDDPRMVNYINLLCREIMATKADNKTNPPLKTVFFGGGTPSLVPPRLVSSVLETLRLQFGLSSDVEMSMEMDPGTFDAVKLKQLMELGVNRVSLGVQAFQDELLKSCGRAHGLKEVYEAIEIVGSCGVENWSMDLISSLPHQTPEMWEESLRLAIEAQPSHVSVYDLQVEQGTKFGLLYKPGEFPLPSDSQSAEFYKMASRMLSNAGYAHYEISSYSKRGFECKHNVTYWKNIPFYGFGLGSASYVGGLRFSRPKSMKGYKEFVENFENGMVYCHTNNQIDFKDNAMDVVMLSLRTAKGLDLKSFGEAFGDSLVVSLCKAYKPYIESGHVVGLDVKGRALSAEEFNSLLPKEDKENIQKELGYIRLSDPDGFLLSNELISHAFGVIAP